MKGALPMGYTREDIIRIVREEEIEFIRMQFVDIFGQLKNVAITASQLEKALNNQVMFDGSSIEGFTRINESDQCLYPDLNSFAILPWHSVHGKVARLICDVYNTDGTPFVGDPRGVLRRVLKRAEDMGFEIEASHHECAIGQHEIDFKYVDALDGADKIMTLKLAVKTLAQKNGLHATFMPKPVYGVAGSGMHLNMSLFKDGRNVFYDEGGQRQLSKTARSFIAGLLRHADGFTALTNPLVNSYKRLGAGYEAPRYKAWSSGNRSTLIRIPSVRGQSTRVELRSPDPSCNPYLAVAACLAAGLDGIAQGLEPPEEISGDVYAMDDAARAAQNIGALPETLKDALDAMEQDRLIMDVLGEHVARHYIQGKRKEWNEYQTRVSSWELEKYLVTY